MSRSSIKLVTADESGEFKTTRWYAIDECQTFNTLATYGCQKLKLVDTPVFNAYEVIGTDYQSQKEKLNMDDTVFLGPSYLLIDQRYEANYALLHTPSTTPNASPPRTPRTPTTGRSLTRMVNTLSFNRPLLEESPSTPVATHQRSAPGTPTTPRSYVTYVDRINRRNEIKYFYGRNKDMVDTKYDNYQHDAPLIYKSVNLFDHFGTKIDAKTSVVLLRENMEEDLHLAADYVITTTIMNLMKEISPELNISQSERREIIPLIHTLTATDRFSALSLTNGKGVLDGRIRKRKVAMNGNISVPQAKMKKSANLDADIDEMSIYLNPMSDDHLLHEKYMNTTVKRSEWLRKLGSKKDADGEDGIVTQVIAKFRHLKSDASLIQYDFETMTKGRRKANYVDLAEVYRKFVPAIIKIATKQTQTQAFPNKSKNEIELLALPLLVSLVEKHCNRSKTELDNLLMVYTDTNNVLDAIQKKKEKQLHQPAIIALNDYDDIKFFLTSDDMALKVKGTLADALHLFIKFNFVFHLKYDESTIGLMYFLEYLMGFTERVTSGRTKLLKLLEKELVATPVIQPIEDDASQLFSNPAESQVQNDDTSNDRQEQVKDLPAKEQREGGEERQ